MATSSVITITGFLFLSFALVVKAACPSRLPYEIGNNCFGFVKELRSFNGARDNCPNKHKDARLSSVSSKEVINELQKIVYKHVEDTWKEFEDIIWIGVYMKDDNAYTKDAKDRLWRWMWDREQFVQKDFSLWDTEGGTSDKKENCGTVEALNNFVVKAVDCGKPRVPVICMRAKGEECKTDEAHQPYFMFGKHCLAVVNGAFEFRHIAGACSDNAPTPVKDEDMQHSVMIAGKNLVIGGSVFLNIQKKNGKFIDLGTEQEVDPDLWEEGEPREHYECAGLSVQANNELKLKTINCFFKASSFCSFPTGSKNETDGTHY